MTQCQADASHVDAVDGMRALDLDRRHRIAWVWREQVGEARRL